MGEVEFWLVWNPEGSRPPSHQHSSLYSAANEAERLAKSAPGQTFYVLHAVELRRTAVSPVEVCTLLKRPEPDPDEMPF